MDRVQAMQVFVRVVDQNSFSRAAEVLALPRASVTTIIQNLEALLGTRLLHRTTRKLALTPDGAAYYERCVRILADIAETEASFQSGARKPQGKLRVDMKGSVGRLLVIPSLCEFFGRYPDIDLQLSFSDRPIDMLQEGVDCVIRVGALPDSSLVARRVGLFERISCASPTYLAKFGMPRTREDLVNHYAVSYFSSHNGRTYSWTLSENGEEIDLKLKSRIQVNDSDAYMTCGVEGFGLIQTARFAALPYLESGQLVEILPEYRPLPMPISMVYPHSRHLSPRVRVFSDWIAELFSRCPLMSGLDVHGATCSMRVPEQREKDNDLETPMLTEWVEA